MGFFLFFFYCTILISPNFITQAYGSCFVDFKYTVFVLCKSLVEHKLDINQSIILFFHFYCTLTLLAIQKLEPLGIKPAQFP